MTFPPDLNMIWYLLLGILLTGYAILDGFDLGVGALHLFTRGNMERRIMINSIGPVWDGNEVWLVTGGGALFAAFPEAYATVFSGFYMVIMLLLVGLIFRAVAIEFRGKQPMRWWQMFWDTTFCISSIMSSILIGIALGNIAWGIPLTWSGDYGGTFRELFHPYALLVGITTVSLFMMHGAIYVVMKTEGVLHVKIRGWINRTIVFFVICYAVTTFVTLVYLPHMTTNLKAFPLAFILPVLNMLAIANIPREIHRERYFRAFLSSCATVAALLTLFGIGMFPNLILSHPVVSNSLTIYNAASSNKTLWIMLIIALIGIPLVIAYTVSIYWIFRGKVRLDETSY
jgi:cytochrome d ubiquinol oxidase subunit II